MDRIGESEEEEEFEKMLQKVTSKRFSVFLLII